MLSALRSMFDSVLSTEQPVAEVSDQTLVPMAASMLFLEVAWADQEISETELAHIADATQTLFDLPADIVADLIDRARKDHEAQVSIYPYTRQINSGLDLSEKEDLLRALWRLALADETLNKHAEARIRHIAELLHVPHSRFISAKLAVKGRS